MKSDDLTYLDTASTTKVDERVLEEMIPYFSEYFGNASSNHSFGKIAKKAIEKVRSQVSQIINCNHDEIIFTSGSTESINLAIKGFVESNTHKGNHIITVKTEHKAVLSTCEYLETKGYEVTYLDVDENGLISVDQLEASKKENSCLVIVMYVNNETGVIQPIKEIGQFAKKNKITFFCDATQAVGKINVDIEEDLIDMLCFSGHKLYGPKGIGVLYKKPEIELTPLIHGGGQEYGIRSGTYNTPLIVGLGKACEILIKEGSTNNQNILELSKYLITSIKKISSFREVSKEAFRVPHILNLIIPDLNSNIFIDKYSSISVSNGSACNSEIITESHVISSMLQKGKFENNYIRISLDKHTTIEDLDNFVSLLKKHIKPNYA